MSGGVSGVVCQEFRLQLATTETTKVLAVPTAGKDGGSSLHLSEWLAAHPQREDIYSALRPLLAERPRQDRTF